MTDKSFFKLDDDGIYYLVAASSIERAKQLMRESQCVFGPDEKAFDAAAGLEQVAQKQRCHTEDACGVIKLSDAVVGDWFSSEW